MLAYMEATVSRAVTVYMHSLVIKELRCTKHAVGIVYVVLFVVFDRTFFFRLHAILSGKDRSHIVRTSGEKEK